MHNWGDVDKDGNDICGQIDEIASFIGLWLRKYARIQVRQYKEKYGTVRVYCSIGFDCFHAIVYPGYCWIHSWWPYKLDLWVCYRTPLMKIINWFVVPVQIRLYKMRYKQAIKKWPQYRDEILCCADYREALKGLF